MGDTIQSLQSLAASLRPAADSPLRDMLADHQRRRIVRANRREADAFGTVNSVAAWEAFRDQRIAALKATLGRLPDPPKKLEVEVTGRTPGEGFVVENVVYPSRGGLLNAAGLYVPDPPREAMPGIVICPSHHRPRTQAELQDMGMTWARAGAMVLVPDMLGHGERRLQPFGGREDYHWRYLAGMQLDLLGESLIGWFAWDLLRGVDLLLGRPGIDPRRIILMGAVAGGGDPAAVAVALDGRIACSIPFNFGAGDGMLADPDDPALPPVKDFFGRGSWESTRNLRGCVPGGFAEWLVVAAAAPRHLVSAHEFEWDPPNDAAYQRIRRVYELYGAADRLDGVRGHGNVTLRPPAATHCTNIGPIHREQLYPILQRWLAMPDPRPEYQQRLEEDQLRAITPEVQARRKPRKLHEWTAERAEQLLAAARGRGAAELRKRLAAVLGAVQPGRCDVASQEARRAGGIAIEQIVLEPEQGIQVPATVLLPAGGGPRRPVVVCIAYEGRARFLRERAAEIAELLGKGVAVCLPDVRGTGSTAPGGGHTWQEEWDTLGIRLSSTELMLGTPLLGSRLADLRTVLAYLRTRADLDAGRTGLWGDSFAATNPAEFDDPPLKTDSPAHVAEPMGALLALLGGLFEEGVRGVLARGGIVGFASAVRTPACYIPHDVIVPGLLAVCDVPDIAAALGPRPVRMERTVDGRNRLVPSHDAEVDVASWLTEMLA